MTRLLAHTPVHITRNGVKLASAFVVEHTDDSDESDTNPEQILRLTITTTPDRRLPLGALKLARPLECEGEDDWTIKGGAYRGVGRVSVGGVS